MKFNISNKTLGKASLWACLVGAVVSTVTNVVGAIRHDRRDKKLYATLQYKAESNTCLPELEKTNE